MHRDKPNGSSSSELTATSHSDMGMVNLEHCRITCVILHRNSLIGWPRYLSRQLNLAIPQWLVATNTGDGFGKKQRIGKSQAITYSWRIFCCLALENLSSCRDGWVMNFISRSKYVFHSYNHRHNSM